ncbi:MAG: sulfatase-like hydrolase/transferase [Thermoleophilaceae bacterium]
MSGREAAGPEAGSEAKRKREHPSNLFAFAHIAALTTFALAQPLFDLLGKNPEFFAARGSTAGDIITFAILLVVVPPVVLFVIELLVGLISHRARDVLHLVYIAVLLAVVIIQPLKKALDAGDLVLIVIPLIVGALVALLYSRAEPMRSFFSVLSVAPIVLLILFLFISPVSKLTLQGDAEAKNVSGGSRAPIVFLGLDEFPGIDLVNGNGELDKKRYPGFAELASKGTWFKNAHSIYDSTSRAWPAIMDGDYPSRDKLPTSADHPNSIFAILGKTHQMNVSEEATSVCPRSLCKDTRLDEPKADRLKSMADDLSVVYKHIVAPPGVEKGLPTVSETWGDFGGGGGGGGGGSASGSSARGGAGGSASPSDKPNTKDNLQGSRNKRLDAWIESIKDTTRPTLNFKHVLLPHVPWQYLPDGRQYRRVATEPIPGISRQSYRDQGQVDVLQQRHLLQLGFADHEVQKLIAHLKEQGLWDKAMVVVTADHGVSFRKGQFDRRKATERNVDEISPVPLFIKAPGQQQGKVNRELVETTDVLPTILDILDIDPKVKMDGRSAFSRQVRDRTQFKMLKRDLGSWIRMPESRFAQLKQAAIDRRIAKFGDTGAFDSRFFRIGPNQELIGTKAQSAGDSQSKVVITAPGDYTDVDPESDTIPIWVTGRVAGGSSTPKDLAVAVNGTVRAVGNTFRLATGGGQLMGVLVPETSFRKGKNDVQVYEVQGGRLLGMGGS